MIATDEDVETLRHYYTHFNHAKGVPTVEMHRKLLARLEQAEQKLTWTDTKPTTPGGYWHRTINEQGVGFVTIYLVYEIEVGQELAAGFTFDGPLTPVSDKQFDGQWSGPLDPPEG